MEEYYNNLASEFEKSSGVTIDSLPQEVKLMYLYAYYHYYNADSSKIIDIIEGNVFENNSTDMICGIYVDQDSDNCDIDILISIHSGKEDFPFPAILKTLKDTENYLCEPNSRYRGKILTFLTESDLKLLGDKPIKIIILTDYCPTTTKKKSIQNAISSLPTDNKLISYNIVFGQEIEYEILEIESPKEYVDSGEIEIDKAGNILWGGNGQSLIVNVSAYSVKELYEMYAYRGLFSQNLRYYVKNAKIDSKIIDSMVEQPDNFWYYNNGIIIICDEYIIKENRLILNNFSIINGGQTTKLIGETEFADNFYVQCKIIKNKYVEESDRLEFISNVAEASNTQKPIKNKDLIANRIEQRLLKKQLAEEGIYCQIKRGEKVNKKLYPAPWQNTTNEELGQFFLSFIYQQPGIARANKASICGNDARYALLFNKQYNTQLIGDILRIKAYYKMWVTHVKKTDSGDDQYKSGLVNNGMLFIMGIIGLLCKTFYHDDYLSKLKEIVSTEGKVEIIAQHDIDHPIFRKELDKENYFNLFEYCYLNYYREGYEYLKSFKPNSSYANFTKVNNNYNLYVFKVFCSVNQNGFRESDYSLLKSILYEANKEEISRDMDLLDIYSNVVSSDFNTEPTVDVETMDRIKTELIEFRTKQYREKKIKAYEVFKNDSADRISKYAPTSLDELKLLRCLDKAQLDKYGEEIIEIVKTNLL